MTILADKRPRLALCLIIALILLVTFLSCTARQNQDVVTFTDVTMGTQYAVRYVTDWRHLYNKNLQKLVNTRLAEINHLMSTYDHESELSQFNLSQSTDWFSVSLETAKVVDYALRIANESQGAFDPTVGPLVNLWGFGPAGRRDHPPSDEAIEAARKVVGYQHLEVQEIPPAVRKTIPKIKIDLSAIAKGYAVDVIGKLLADLGYESYMVEIGGEVITCGTKPGELPWRIGVEKPDATNRTLQMIIELDGSGNDRALATSGDYRNFFEHDGKRFSHTIDPRSGWPVIHNLATVTVRAESCMKADTLATALLVLGPKKGYDWAEGQGISAWFAIRHDEQIKQLTTSAWRRTNDGESENSGNH